MNSDRLHERLASLRRELAQAKAEPLSDPHDQDAVVHYLELCVSYLRSAHDRQVKAEKIK
jgi:hypothetical protein